MSYAVPSFRTVAIAEALSWTGLLIGMFFKYLVVGNDIGVTIFGPIHGGLFLLYLAVTVLVRRPLGWNAGTTVLALIASVPPLATLVFERWAARTGRLRPHSDAGPASEPAASH
ncbi:MAG: DUF3817 domain-containing protein [Pseudonocardiaceae bacterium]|nr:DUF3817 domain-containing protein [Pseudonocardiaceae bacterium]